MNDTISLNRRAFIGSGIALASAAGLVPAWARSTSHGLATKDMATLSGEDISLTIGHADLRVNGKAGHAIAVNGTVPAGSVQGATASLTWTFTEAQATGGTTNS